MKMAGVQGVETKGSGGSSGSLGSKALLEPAIIMQGNNSNGNVHNLSLMGRSRSNPITPRDNGFHYPTSRYQNGNEFLSSNIDSTVANRMKDLPKLNAVTLEAPDTAESTTTSDSSHSGIPTTPLQLTVPPSIVESSPIVTPRTAARNEVEIQLEQERTAGLIFNLYQRLEEQGVEGDGYEEGRERSRDGIIHRKSSAISTNLSHFNSIVQLNGNLPQREEQILQRVDRYGFFSESHPAALASQHNRLATLTEQSFQTLPTSKPFSKSSTPSSKLSPRDRNSSVASLLPALTPILMKLEMKRIQKWSEMLIVSKKDSGGNTLEWSLDDGYWNGRNSNGEGGGGGGKFRKFQRRVFKGVPDRWRRAVWGLQLEHLSSEISGGDLPTLAELTTEYRNYLNQPSAQDVQIDLDVPRTISGNVLFHTRYGQGQRSLFHVLHAFGLHCDKIGGYCQGMGPIAATFLCYFEPERAYACLVRLCDQYGLGHIFAPGFPGLIESFYVQEKLVEFLMPEVHTAFNTHFISSSAYATKWYITLFSNSVPFSTQLRLWDGLLLEGIDFLIITSIAIIWSFRGQFTASNASFESILSSLSSYFLVESEDALLRWIRKVLRRQDLRKKMKEWRSEWQGFVADGSWSKRIT